MMRQIFLKVESVGLTNEMDMGGERKVKSRWFMQFFT